MTTSRPTLWSASIQECRTQVDGATLERADLGKQVMRHRVETAGGDPVLGSAGTPRATAEKWSVASAMAHRCRGSGGPRGKPAQVVVPLRAIRRRQRRIWGEEGPRLVGHVGEAGLTGCLRRQRTNLPRAKQA